MLAVKLRGFLLVLSGRRSPRLHDLLLQADGLVGQLLVGRTGEIGIEAALVLDGADAAGRKLEPHHAAERLAVERGLVDVGQEAPPRLALRVADIVAGLNARAGDAAAPRHDPAPSDFVRQTK